MPEQTKDLAPVQKQAAPPATQESGGVWAVIEMAVNKGEGPETLEKLLALQERWEANEARKAYTKAMAAFKADPPNIVKDKLVSYDGKAGGRTQYRHATLANVTSVVSAALAKHGLAAAWKTDQENGQVSVTCTVTHELGHSEITTLSAAPDNSGSKNPIQAIGSTVSYLERYTLLALLGLATYDPNDNDGAGAPIEYLDEAQVGTIRDLMAEHGVDPAKFCVYMHVESIEKIPVSRFQQACTAIKAKKKDGAG